MRLAGTLFQYLPGRRLVAFQSGAATTNKKYVVFLGGLTDSFLCLPYLVPLSESLQALGWCLVQAQLSSSGLGYGIQSLQTDAEELDALLRYLLSRHSQSGGAKEEEEEAPPTIVLLGHSTGCQDCIYFLQQHQHSSRRLVRGVILQAPVSDREYMQTLPSTSENKALAERMLREGKEEELMPRGTDPTGAPICARRYHSLVGRMTCDDMFSSDFTEEERRLKLAIPSLDEGEDEREDEKKKWPPKFLLVCSMKDEYVPECVDKRKLVDEMCRALPQGSEGFYIEDADHALSSLDAQQQFLSRVTCFLQNIV
ncbi:Fusarinine C esterase sidJ [Balamuthia mandrillaris]